jgi:mannose-1-phosphate guanylyltransferase
MYALVMAGGSGTRLWPRSRQHKPKQFLDLVGSQTMLQATVNRIAPLIPRERVFVVTSAEYGPLIREQIPDLPRENMLIEPAARGTAACIGLGAVHLRRLDPDGVMVALPADHLIYNEHAFRRALEGAGRVAGEDYLVTLGIAPDRPETGYGYIQRGLLLRDDGDGPPVYQVEKFTEKPDEITARRFVESGEYYWNGGIFVWKFSAILKELHLYLPGLYERLMAIEAAIGSADEREVLMANYLQINPETVDFGVMERARRVAVVPVDMGWSDVGSWATIHSLLPADADGNVVSGEHIGLDTTGSFICGSRRLIATIGVSHLIVVDTEDALLICPRERAQEVKDIVERLKREGEEGYL